MTKHTKTPAQIIACMIRCGMNANGMNAVKLAKAVNVCPNTVRNNLSDPESMTLDRVFMYFAVLGIPTEKVLFGLAGELPELICRRE